MNKVLSITGLDAAKLAPVVKGLETLLATFQVYYTNLRGYHWHVRGPQFFVLHEQFEKMYDGVAETIDELAERLLQLDVQPENRFSVLVGQSKIKETTLLSKQEEILPEIVENYKTLIALEREVLEAASEAGDEVTVALMGDLLAEQEKSAWMFAAYLS
ncbi:MAG: Dps family protein [Porphyromonadaceae bacterium]|nr:Dps family protein [Porphyromonadaceae bacterium]